VNKPGAAANLTQLSGKLLERGVLRRTPAGIAAIEFRLGHQSEQIEAETPRKVDCEMNCVALGMPAGLLADARPDAAIRVTGFLAARSIKIRAPVLHVQRIEFVEGNENGFQTEK